MEDTHFALELYLWSTYLAATHTFYLLACHYEGIGVTRC